MRRARAQARLRECERDKDAAEARARELERRADALQRELAAARERPPAPPANGHRAATDGGADAGAPAHAAAAGSGGAPGADLPPAAAAAAALQARLHAQEERVRQLERRVADGRRVALVSETHGADRPRSPPPRTLGLAVGKTQPLARPTARAGPPPPPRPTCSGT
jgi:chromosome segregation ATPase